MTALLEAKIARILDLEPGVPLAKARFVLNIGSNRGVEVGMAFGDANAETDEITDPDSGEVLDNIPRYYWRLIVDSVRYSVAVCHIEGNYSMRGFAPGDALVQIRK